MMIDRSVSIQVCVVAALLVMPLPISLSAQVVEFGGPVIIRRGGIVAGGDLVLLEDVEGGQDDDAEEVAGAVLKTDPDLEQRLELANRHAEDGNYRVSTRLWQSVLENSGDSLYSEDKIRYYSIADQVERILAQLPPDGLEVYRITADASARQILNEADDPNNVAALMRVASNYFVSSVGDDAAFRLGCLYLDRHDFSGALRMFEKIANEHPDPSVALDEVHARIAICHAFMGNTDSANNSLVAGRNFVDDSPAIEAVQRSIANLAPSEKRNAVLRQWSMSQGNERRMAAMPALPESAFTGDQVAQWQFYVLPRDARFLKLPDTVGKVLAGTNSYQSYAADTRNTVEKLMIKEWAENGYRPAGHLMFDEERVFFKGPADLVAFDRSKISKAVSSESSFSVSAFASWRSVWRNVFEVDLATERAAQVATARLRSFNRNRAKSGSTAKKLALVPKTLNFDDLIYQQMSMHDGVVYTIEGKSFDQSSRHSKARPQAHGWNVNYRRTRNNFLTAYESDSGRLLWRLPRVNKAESPSFDPTKKVDDDTDRDLWLRDGGMMSAPVKFADLLIVPVNQNGAIHLYGIDPAREGKTVWSSFLCDEPETGSVVTSPINLTIDGSDLFVTCGTGVLFVIDPTTGKVRFAKRYRRTGQPDLTVRRNAYNTGRTNFDGWSSDVIIPNDNELICFCSDTDSIVAIDRNDGSLLWKNSLRPYNAKVDYVIGAWGDLLYLGGKQTIIAINLKSEGYLEWGGEVMFDGANTTGRGMVTPQGVFVPVGKAIWRFALEPENGRAEVLNQVEAFLGTESPVGNLYSDGERIWVHGASRLYALSPKED